MSRIDILSILQSNVSSFLDCSKGQSASFFFLHIKGNNLQSHGILNDLGWEIYPQRLYDLITHIMNRWGKDILIFITKNGVADKSDKYSVQFIVSHLRQIRKAMDNGANIIGYLHWSLSTIMSDLITVDLKQNLGYFMLILLTIV
jgi:beta-glucosidase/6-phospho-beta-glucosidase/beta-galactosidase